MSRLEYVLASLLLRVVGRLSSIRPVDPGRVVLATARVPTLDGNLAYVYAAMRARYPDRRYTLLLEPYSYGLRGRLAYLARLVRGMYLLRTSGLFIVDNAYLPIHVEPHRPGTTVVQLWHAVGALKRFGLDTTTPLTEPERTFLHRYYDYVVVPAEGTRAPYGAALHTPVERVLALRAPRTDFFFDEVAMRAARERLIAAHPILAGRKVVLCAPTFRGRGRGKYAGSGLDAVRLRAALPDDHALVLKTHPNLDPAATPREGFDVVAPPASEMNDWLALADILVTDYSSSIFEYALLRRPLILFVPDLEAYEIDPGLYLDYRTEMIGTKVVDTEGVIAAILGGAIDAPAYDAFIERHIGVADGRASERFVGRFLGEGRPGGR